MDTHTHTHLEEEVDNRPMNHAESYQQPNKAESQFATSGPFHLGEDSVRDAEGQLSISGRHVACSSFPAALFRRLMANSKGIHSRGFRASRGLEYGVIWLWSLQLTHFNGYLNVSMCFSVWVCDPALEYLFKRLVLYRNGTIFKRNTVGSLFHVLQIS